MQTAEELRKTIDEACIRFASIPEKDWNHKPLPEKWSKKEILGHLTDSAFNNHRRFVVTQYDQNNKIIYLQDDWVRINAYQQIKTDELIHLWKLLNKQIARVMESIPTEKLLCTCDTGKQGKDLKTLKFLMEDYIAHMNHHLGKII